MTQIADVSCRRRRALCWDARWFATVALVTLWLLVVPLVVRGSMQATTTAFVGLPHRTESLSTPSQWRPSGSPSRVCRLGDATNPNHSVRMEEQINSGLERAKLILEKSRAKLAARAEEQSEAPEAVTVNPTDRSVPFFAQMVHAPSLATVSSSSRDSLVKTVNDETGLITIDGEKMAAQSEREEWEFRPLSQVFTSPSDEEALVSATTTSTTTRIPTPSGNQLADRDVLASIYNLRMLLQRDDYQKIFDSKNRFIGEDN